jgi:hypothetical protein
MTVSRDNINATIHRSLSQKSSLGDTKKLYRDSLSQLCDIFPDWAEDDLVAALTELGGDVELVVSRISEGNTTLCDILKI